MNSDAHKYIIRVLIVVIVLLMSMQVVSGAFDTELEFVPRHGPSFGIDVQIGRSARIDLTIGWKRPCGGLIEVEYLSVAIRTDPSGQD